MVRLAVAQAAVVAAGQQSLEHLGAVEVSAHGVNDTSHQHGDGQPVVGGTCLLQFVEQDVELDWVAVAVARYRAG